MRAASRAPPRESPLFKTGRTTIWRTSAKTRTPHAQVRFFVRRPLSGLQGRPLLALETCWVRLSADRTPHASPGEALRLGAYSASVAPLTTLVPSRASADAATATIRTIPLLLLAKRVSSELLPLFKQLRHTKTRKAARVAVTPRVAGRDKTTAHKIL